MEKNDNYGLCGTSTIIINSEGKEIQKKRMKQYNNEIKNNILKSNQFTHSSIILRKNILDKVGGYYNKEFNGAEDYELWLRIGEISKFYNIPEYLVKYRWLKTSISRKKWLKQELLTFKIMIKNKNNYPDFFKSLFLRIGYFILKILKIKD